MYFLVPSRRKSRKICTHRFLIKVGGGGFEGRIIPKSTYIDLKMMTAQVFVDRESYSRVVIIRASVN